MKDNYACRSEALRIVRIISAGCSLVAHSFACQDSFWLTFKKWCQFYGIIKNKFNEIYEVEQAAVLR